MNVNENKAILNDKTLRTKIRNFGNIVVTQSLDIKTATKLLPNYFYLVHQEGDHDVPYKRSEAQSLILGKL